MHCYSIFVYVRSKVVILLVTLLRSFICCYIVIYYELSSYLEDFFSRIGNIFSQNLEKKPVF